MAVSGQAVADQAVMEATFVREFECGDQVAQVHQQCVGDVGCVVWDAVCAMALYAPSLAIAPALLLVRESSFAGDSFCQHIQMRTAD